MEKTEIKRKDGIVYERKIKDKIYDSVITFRISTEQREQLMKIAKETGVKMNVILRNLIADFISGNTN